MLAYHEGHPLLGGHERRVPLLATGGEGASSNDIKLKTPLSMVKISIIELQEGGWQLTSMY
jgi:hypothetical protein